MTRRLLNAAIAVAIVATGFVAFALPASAAQRSFKVRLTNGSIITVTVDAPCGTTPSLPGELVNEITPPEVCNPPAPTTPSVPTTPSPPPSSGSPDNGGGSGGGGGGGGGGSTQPSSGGGGDRPSSHDGDRQGRSGSKHHAQRDSNPQAQGDTGGGQGKKKRKRSSDGVPTPDNPTYFDALPGPATIDGVPNFVIQKFKVPIFLLPIYQAAGIQYGIRWEVLAAINEIETDYGRNLNISSAGALGWMQFMPSTWDMYGTDANKDHVKDPYNPVDAIFAAARYLKAAGGDHDIRRAIFAYNHADWYVDSVMLRSKLIAGYPADLVGSLTGLTEGRFPVAARARYADDRTEAEAKKLGRRSRKEGNRALVVEGSKHRRGIKVFARRGAPVVAVNDGRIVRVGRSKRLGSFVQLQDTYGNTYTYARLAKVAKSYPAPRQRTTTAKQVAKELELPAKDAALSATASSTTEKATKRERAAKTKK